MEYNNTVLFVDDEIDVLNAIRRALSDEPFKCVFAASGKEALKILEDKDISVVVTDMRMPGMDGLTLLKEIREKYPKTVRMVLSGYTQISQVLATVNQGDIFQFIPKPWKMEEELLAGIRQALDYYNLDAERDKLQNELVQKNKSYQNIFIAMEQMLANEKKDIANLQRVHNWIFTFWKKQMEIGEGRTETKSTEKAYIQLIEELLIMYITMLPNKREEKNTVSLIADLVKACAGRIVINNAKDMDRKLLGYYGFLAAVFKALVYMIAPDVKAQVMCDMEVHVENEENLYVSFTINLNSRKLAALEHNRLRVGCSFLSEMGKAYHVKIQPDVMNGEVSVILVLWEASIK